MRETGRVRTADFHFDLPLELIAQHPAPQRDESRLLVLERPGGGVAHRQFRDLPQYFRAGDVLVLNNSRVIPARLRGINARTGGQFELLLLEENARNDWWAMLRPGKHARPGTQIACQAPDGTAAAVHATVVATNSEGHRRLHFSGTPDLREELDRLGEVPLPPYIQRDRQCAEDRERYQTVYAQDAGSVAAPTAGLHFTPELLAQIRARGVTVCFVTLHIGPGTFQPVKTETLAAHKMHEERFELSEEAARIVNAAKIDGRRVIAVGTTAMRVLESVAAQNRGKCAKNAGKTGIFIHPPFSFQIVDALLTNFHLPCSTLLMLVSAFAAPGATRGREMVLAAYAEAVRQRYHFFSYGDAMLVL
jgi:S-adenosylmethionine:tRNA ribosyltransferase-isomerase